MTPLPTYDRRHHAPVAPVAPVARTSLRPSIVRNRRRPIALTGALILVAALIGGVSIFAWDRTGSRDQNDELASAIDTRNRALATAATLSDRVEELRDRLAKAQARATSLESEVAATQAELLAMLGPALPDGMHFGELYAVGANQDPPRLVIDIEQWFTDQAAVDAAIEDGITVDPGINGYYIRNAEPRWRTVEIDPGARVTITSYPYGDPTDPREYSLDDFGDLFYSFNEMPLHAWPYWVTVKDEQIVAIEQQFIP
jgi:hypothetical protein